jgi:hypothetical protein
MKSLQFGLGSVLVMVSVGLPVLAEPLEPATACARRNVPQTTVLLDVEFHAEGRTGSARSSRAKIYGRLFEDGLRKSLIRFIKPPSIRDSAMLVLEAETPPNTTYVYVPDEGRVRRVSGRSGAGLFGTDFSSDDVEWWQGLASEGEVRREPDTQVEGRTVYVLESVPAAAPEESERSAYERVRRFIDQETCVVLRTEFFEHGDTPRKRLDADPASVTKSGDLLFPLFLVLEDLRKETRTRVEVQSIQVDVDIPDRRFRMVELSRGSR